MRGLWALLLASMAWPAAAETPAPGLHDLSFRSRLDGTPQSYTLFVPQVHEWGEALPLVVALHGLGGDRHRFFDDTAIADWAEREGWLVLSPDARGDWFYLGPGEDDVFQAIDEVIARCRVDEQRLFLMGHSMGGWGAWQLATAQPDRFAAIVALASWAPVELLPSIAHIPAFVIHGERDQLIGIHNARSAVRTLRDTGGKPLQWEAPTYGHHPRLITTLLPEIATWLRDKRRPPLDEQISLRTRTPRRGGREGASILATDTFPALASLEATLSPQGVAEVSTLNVTEFSLPHAWSPSGAEVNGQTLRLPEPRAHEAVVFARAGAGWQALAVPEERLSPPQPGEVLELATASRPNHLRIGEALAKATGADATLLPRLFNTPAPSPGALDEDTLLDLWPEPMHVQWIGIARASTLRQVLGRGTHRMVPQLNLDNGKRLYTITFPALGEPRLPEGMWAVSTGRRTIELLHDRIRQTEEMP